jgi:hypothetical protein
LFFLGDKLAAMLALSKSTIGIDRLSLLDESPYPLFAILRARRIA